MKKILNRAELSRRIAETGLTPFSFAKKNGYIYESLRRWLNGAHEPNPKYIKTLAENLGCRMEDLVVWELNDASIDRLEIDRDRLASILPQLTQEQRERLIALAEKYADLNQAEAEAEL